MAYEDIIFEDKTNLYVKSDTDGLYVMPWKFLHDGYNVSRQDTVVSVDADAGIPISHSRFSVGGRLINARIYVDSEPDWWLWYIRATNSRALPFWFYDLATTGYSRCYMLNPPKLSKAGDSVDGVYVSLELFARGETTILNSIIVQGETPDAVVEGASSAFVYDSEEVMY